MVKCAKITKKILLVTLPCGVRGGLGVTGGSRPYFQRYSLALQSMNSKYCDASLKRKWKCWWMGENNEQTARKKAVIRGRGEEASVTGGWVSRQRETRWADTFLSERVLTPISRPSSSPGHAHSHARVSSWPLYQVSWPRTPLKRTFTLAKTWTWRAILTQK